MAIFGRILQVCFGRPKWKGVLLQCLAKSKVFANVVAILWSTLLEQDYACMNLAEDLLNASIQCCDIEKAPLFSFYAAEIAWVFVLLSGPSVNFARRFHGPTVFLVYATEVPFAVLNSVKGLSGTSTSLAKG